MKKIQLLFAFLMVSIASQAQFNLNLLGHLPYPSNTCAGVWHYVDSLGNEYALVGVDDRVAIVDVTTPATLTEVFSVPALTGQSSLWREIKTFGKYAYAVSEGGGGVMIIDLSALPGSINSKHYYGDGVIANQITSAHTIAVTDGYAYVFGTGNGLANGGALILDLADPWNPTYVGQYNLEYIHDGYIRNDTLWAGEIYAGQFSVIDVSNKANPVLLATQATPGQFCHNTWLTDNSQFLFTTDEINGQPLGSFDVTNLSNIKLVDTYLTDSMPNEEVHNVRVLNDYLINPSYGSQLVICDGARPNNIVEIASYPTGSFLCWDASPYLPSGRIIVADVDGGVYVFEPTYQRACYLEGTVTDSLTGIPLNNVTIIINPTAKSTTTNLVGEYKTGIVTAGTYDIEFRKAGYVTKFFTGVSLVNGQLTTINTLMSPFVLQGIVTNATTTAGVAGAAIYANDGINTATAIADASGNFSFTNLSSGNIDITATHWGYVTYCQTVFVDGSIPFSISLQEGYYDDFVTDLGWTINSTATNGVFERGDPEGTIFGPLALNPELDVNSDCGDFAYVTGLLGGSASTHNLDNGFTEITSPIFDLTNYVDPYINYSRWFSSPANVPLANRDTLFIRLTDGVNTVTLEAVSNTTPGIGTWVNQFIKVSNYITPGANMQLKVFIEDKPNSGNFLESGFDAFSVTEGFTGVNENLTAGAFTIYPNPGNGTFQLNLNDHSNGESMYLTIYDATGRLISTEEIVQNEGHLYGTKIRVPGLYIIGLYKDGALVSTKKLIKSN
ncbi:MAG: choice-of-anchor B family protein [Bacteroidia bacterium]|nr:choice-of-anchor B family protein [Bacteroidia bacterium]